MNKRIPSKKIQRLSEIIISLNQQEIEQFVYLFKDRMIAKPKNFEKQITQPHKTPVHTKRFPHPIYFYNNQKNVIFNFYFSLFQALRTTTVLLNSKL